ncbi:LolA family protein [Streptomyces zagrosensis]|uniref:Outer membrane lipoprotein-sorting protein n=1 Tax=Streptomyces zagrosensis TaxID=1042984 RepID=A0A7W9V0E6_9ACTN|nr:outer membrane lipoprotein carrier protein LolA [Streptomyces zagrosensis]MBB5938088.1 outer membrane lipoprotein-sorting protein [Streptomyces zagrosensis]
MARTRSTEATDDWDQERPARRYKAARYAVPVAVAGVAAATIGLVPALASSGDPDLPQISAEELITKIAESDTQQLSGSVKISTDLGIPGLSAGSSLGGMGGGQHGGDDEGDSSSAAPQAKLAELAAGSHTLRVAVDGPEKQRVSIIEDAAEYSMIRNANQVWAYDSGSNSVYHATAPKEAHAQGKGDHAKQLPKDLRDATPQELAKKVLAGADETTSVTVDGTAKVAGRDAYQLKLTPKGDTTIGSIRIAVDADNGTPLKFTLAPKSGGKAVVDVGFTKVNFDKPKASTFNFTPPKGAKVTEAQDLDRKAGKSAQREELSADALSGLNVIGEGWNSVAKLKVPSGLPTEHGGNSEESAAADQFLNKLGDKVKGDFGSGTVFSTRLVNALLTDDGTVYVGAVGKDTLIDAANKGK